MAFVLFPALCLLSGAYALEWGVTFAPGTLSGWVGSCVTFHCSFSSPAGQNVAAVMWETGSEQIVYRSDNDRIDAAFTGRVRYLGDLRNNCSLQLARLRPSDQGTYRFWVQTERDGWRSDPVRDVSTPEPGQQLTVSASPCHPSLGSRMDPGPSLNCSVGVACPHRPSWYDADGSRRSPGQTPAGEKATELPISPSQLPPGVVLRCQVDGYWDGCGSDQPQPPGPVAPNMPSVEVLWPSGKTAIKAGDGFILRCQASALGPGTRYVWSRGDVWLHGGSQDFRIEKADVSDGGSYSCGVWVSGPGWAYLSLSARESVEVQRCDKCQHLIPGLEAGISVTCLVLIALVNMVACYRLRRRWRQAAQGAELSCQPEAEPTYEELQRPSQDIYSQLDYPRVGSH